MILEFTADEISALIDILDIFAGEHDSEFARDMATRLWNGREEDREWGIL